MQLLVYNAALYEMGLHPSHNPHIRLRMTFHDLINFVRIFVD